MTSSQVFWLIAAIVAGFAAVGHVISPAGVKVAHALVAVAVSLVAVGLALS